MPLPEELELLDVTVRDVVDTIGSYTIGDFYEWVGESVIKGERTPISSRLGGLTPLQKKACEILYDEVTKNLPNAKPRKRWRLR